MTILINAEKVCDKIQHFFMIKKHSTNWTEGNCNKIIKAIHDKPTDDNILCGEKLKALPLRSGKIKDAHLKNISWIDWVAASGLSGSMQDLSL